MPRKFNWNQIQATTDNGGTFEKLPAGPYVCRIVEMVDEPSREYVNIVFDIAEGEHAGFFSDDWGKSHPYAHQLKLSYKETAQGPLKGRLEAIAASNPGFDPFAAWDADRLDMFTNRLVGVNVQYEEYERQGQVRERIFAFSPIVPAQSVRDGKVQPRETRRLNGGVGKVGGGRVVTSQPVDDIDIPFN